MPYTRPSPSWVTISSMLTLSSWKLRLSHHTPLIWVKREVLEDSTPQHLLESLEDVMRERSLTRQIVLVLLDGDSQPLLKQLASLTYNLVVIGAEEQERILQSRRPSGELLDLISGPDFHLQSGSLRNPGTRYRKAASSGANTRFPALSATQTRTTPSSAFDVSQDIPPEGGGAYPDGNRRPGSPGLLECSDLLGTEDYVREVVRKLNPKELPRLHMQKYVFFFPDFLERMARAHKNKIIFLLDEVDNLVIEQRGDWELFRMLRASANKGAASTSSLDSVRPCASNTCWILRSTILPRRSG